ncbi:DUF2793 domain-containing protein [Aurantimonas sp. E1-2-R+4]|uniref:DUF2793 domain-containing protein n=1 Tax=Aurantimonas sp. E1-2-R+4 TaxID=3113714 RepID=UPI002F91CD7F
MELSPNLSLPYVMPAQAQKHVTHNEAIDILDIAVQLMVESATVLDPPVTPAEGTRFVVPPAATGVWTGESGNIAVYSTGGWRFLPPANGMRAWVKDSAQLYVYDQAGWAPLGALATGDMSPDTVGISTSADATNRLAVASPGSLFSHDGGDHRMVLNKAAIADTASLIFQTGFSGRAEFGLAGDEDFSVKVSPDGAIWREAMKLDRATGRAAFPQGVQAPGHILQVVSARLTTGFTTTLDTPQVTGLSVTLTPFAADSTIIVRASLVLGANFWSTAPRVGVYRDGVKVWPSQAGVFMQHQMLADTPSNSRLITHQAAIEFADQPATASAVTYDIRLASSFAGVNVHLNIRDYDLLMRGESNMSVTEVAT